MIAVNITIDVCALIILLLAFNCVYFAAREKNTRKRLLCAILGTIFLGTVFDILSYAFENIDPGGGMWYFTIFLTFIPVQAWTSLLVFFLISYLKEKGVEVSPKLGRITLTITGTLLILALVSFATGRLFAFENGQYVHMPAEYIIGGGDCCVLIMYCISCLRYRKQMGKQSCFVFLAYALTPAVAYIIEYICPGVFCLYFAMAVSTLMCLLSVLNHDIIERSEHLKAQNERLQALANIYLTMHIIDLKNDTFEQYNATDLVRRFINKRAGAVEMMANVISRICDEESVEKALKFTDLTTIGDRLIDKNTISEEFTNVNHEWVRGRFIVIDRDEDRRPINIIWATVAVQAEKKREEGLIHISRTDELTQVNNRHAYGEALRRYEEDKSAEVSIISMDLNGLKNVNDNLGHAAGDELIRGAADCMVEAFGKYGDIYRTGGDEFVVLVETDDDSLLLAIENFQGLLNNWKGNLVTSISVSLGFIHRRDYPDRTMEQLISIADKKMYEMKKNYYDSTGCDRRKHN